MSAEKEPIGVIGVGWVGLCTAACFAELGHEVHARDILPEKVASLSAGEVTIHEPGLPELLSRNAERLHFTTDMARVLDNAELLFCCVDTPPTYSGDADLSRVESVLAELKESTEHAIVMKSTVPVGTGRSIARRAPHLGYVANPEFLKEGTAVKDFMYPDRVVVGVQPTSSRFAGRVAALYEPLGAPVVETDVASAEMIKLASNAFLATKISFINEIANVSEELGADVKEVARGMGLDQRIGDKFLNAGIGYGGSCFAPEESVLARIHGHTRLLTLEALYDDWREDELEVLSWLPGDAKPRYLPVSVVTKREYDGEMVEVQTKMGRRVQTTADHPWIVGDGAGALELEIKLASQLTCDDWIPLAQGLDAPVDAPELLPLLGAMEEGDLVRVRPAATEMERFGESPASQRREAGVSPSRAGDIRRTGTLKLDELARLGLSPAHSTLGTARNGQFVASDLIADSAFWRVVGLYLAEGHTTDEAGGRRRIQWTFHPNHEEHLVDEVAAFWLRHGVEARAYSTATARTVAISSRIAATWWTRVLGLGSGSYGRRFPDLVWDQPQSHKRALLSALFEGDGSWSLVNGGPSVIIELGTISRELADGTMRLLGDLGIVASQRVGRGAKSTGDTYWLRIAGAEQVERAIELVPARDRAGVLASIARQSKRTAPTGYRRFREGGPAWVRVAKVSHRRYHGPVYSLEVPASHTVVGTGGLMLEQCFPKDVSALKQLAGNSGYHFQLLTAVIEVNELQKRRTIGKLQKHLGSLVGKEIALLGVAFKPDTDDVREATSLVLAARLQGEGANVRVYDPVAAANAAELLGGARVCASVEDALDGADAVVLVTEWPEFADLDWAGEVKSRMATPLVVDGRNFLDRDGLREAGFTYEGIGR
jgi:UDPglucose 6-dehydrogenase